MHKNNYFSEVVDRKADCRLQLVSVEKSIVGTGVARVFPPAMEEDAYHNTNTKTKDGKLVHFDHHLHILWRKRVSDRVQQDLLTANTKPKLFKCEASSLLQMKQTNQLVPCNDNVICRTYHQTVPPHK